MDVDSILRFGQGPVLRFLARTAGTAQAQDLAQETFVRAVRAMERGERPERPLPWLLGIARNVLLEWLRSGRYERGLQERLVARFEPWLEPAFQDTIAQRLVVAQALNDLPGELREAVTLHYFAGLRVGEVGRQLNISTGAVKTRLWRARRILRAPLASLIEKEELVTVFDHLQVLMYTGGIRGATEPFGPILFNGRGLNSSELAEAIDRLHRVREAGEVLLSKTLYLWPMVDPFENPKPAAVWTTCRAGDIAQEDWNAQWDSGLVPSDGWRIGTYPGAETILDEFKQAGLRRVHFTLAGLRDTHDSLAARPGTFDAIVRAMDLCAERDIDVSSNIIVSTRNIAEVEELMDLVRGHGGGYVAAYTPLRTDAIYEAIRPEPADLEGLRPERWKRPAESEIPYADFWSDPAAFTEQALTRRALEDDVSPLASYYGPPLDREAPPLVVDASFDIHAGNVREQPIMRVGNLRSDDPTALHRAIASLRVPALPSDRSLASRYGEPEGTKTYMNRAVLRTKWVRAWRAENNVAWLA